MPVFNLIQMIGNYLKLTKMCRFILNYSTQIISIVKYSTHLFLYILTFFIFLSCDPVAEKTASDNTETSKMESRDILPSWNEGGARQQIIDFVQDVTNENGPNFIEVKDRIATFDNDGTLWSEQPAYFQLLFALDRIKAMSADHPEWKSKEPYKSVLAGDMKGLVAQGKKGLLEIIASTHAGMTTDEFEKIVLDWTKSARHPSKDRLYTELVYQPMLELLDYLRANDFKVFIVSGGGIEFMRPWTEEVYYIPRNQVVGSSIKTKYNYNDGNPVIERLAEIDFIDDKEGKPEGINKHIGRKPVFSAGNSDGDLQMLRWADANELKSFKLYIHHTDADREWAYDRDSHIGQFDKGLDEANEKGWTVVDMKNEWKVIYPFESNK